MARWLLLSLVGVGGVLAGLAVGFSHTDRPEPIRAGNCFDAGAVDLEPVLITVRKVDGALDVRAAVTAKLSDVDSGWRTGGGPQALSRCSFDNAEACLSADPPNAYPLDAQLALSGYDWDAAKRSLQATWAESPVLLSADGGDRYGRCPPGTYVPGPFLARLDGADLVLDVDLCRTGTGLACRKTGQGSVKVTLLDDLRVPAVMLRAEPAPTAVATDLEAKTTSYIWRYDSRPPVIEIRIPVGWDAAWTSASRSSRTATARIDAGVGEVGVFWPALTQAVPALALLLTAALLLWAAGTGGAGAALRLTGGIAVMLVGISMRPADMEWLDSSVWTAGTLALAAVLAARSRGQVAAAVAGCLMVVFSLAATWAGAGALIIAAAAAVWVLASWLAEATQLLASKEILGEDLLVLHHIDRYRDAATALLLIGVGFVLGDGLARGAGGIEAGLGGVATNIGWVVLAAVPLLTAGVVGAGLAKRPGTGPAPSRAEVTLAALLGGVAAGLSTMSLAGVALPTWALTFAALVWLVRSSKVIKLDGPPGAGGLLHRAL